MYRYTQLNINFFGNLPVNYW